MYLLNVNDKKRHDFNSKPLPSYAMVSHRWSANGEVQFHDIQDFDDPDDVAKPERTPPSAGFSKVEEACKWALRDGYQYIWIDTCCYDRNSPDSVSNTLNSLNTWLRKAAACYAHLADVQSGDQEAEFGKSDWFTRGWTLQELLIPEKVAFFDRDWNKIGEKATLAGKVSEITGINMQVLKNPDLISRCSIAARMSWAARRGTRRSEDRAYSLMGIFGVQMPIIYGEGGTQAFLRLQQEIIKTSNDQSILAWNDPRESHAKPWGGPFARSPDCFSGCDNIHHIPPVQWSKICRSLFREKRSYHFSSASTNGVDTTLPLSRLEISDEWARQWRHPQGTNIFSAVLNCYESQFEEDFGDVEVVLKRMDLKRIFLTQASPDSSGKCFERLLDHSNLGHSPMLLADAIRGHNLQKVRLADLQPSSHPPRFLYSILTFIVRCVAIHDPPEIHAAPGYILDQYKDEDGIHLRTEKKPTLGEPLEVARVEFKDPSGEKFSVLLGVSSDFDLGGGVWVQCVGAGGLCQNKPRGRMDWTTHKLTDGRNVRVTMWAENRGSWSVYKVTVSVS